MMKACMTLSLGLMQRLWTVLLILNMTTNIDAIVFSCLAVYTLLSLTMYIKKVTYFWLILIKCSICIPSMNTGFKNIFGYNLYLNKSMFKDYLSSAILFLQHFSLWRECSDTGTIQGKVRTHVMNKICHSVLT